MNIKDLVHWRETSLLRMSDKNYVRWRDASMVVGAPASHLTMDVQSDGLLDTELRLMEEQIRVDWPNSDPFLFTQYVRQSRYWFLSIYEVVRTYLALVKNRQHLKQCDIDSVKMLYQALSLVRIPLAKLQPAGAHKKGAPPLFSQHPVEGGGHQYVLDVTPYTPRIGFDHRVGSGWWAVADLSDGGETRVIYRRAVSDEFLRVFSRQEGQ